MTWNRDGSHVRPLFRPSSPTDLRARSQRRQRKLCRVEDGSCLLQFRALWKYVAGKSGREVRRCMAHEQRGGVRDLMRCGWGIQHPQQQGQERTQPSTNKEEHLQRAREPRLPRLQEHYARPYLLPKTSRGQLHPRRSSQNRVHRGHRTCHRAHWKPSNASVNAQQTSNPPPQDDYPSSSSTIHPAPLRPSGNESPSAPYKGTHRLSRYSTPRRWVNKVR